jgi:capsular exopolysaccharide synthesis family protein
MVAIFTETRSPHRLRAPSLVVDFPILALTHRCRAAHVAALPRKDPMELRRAFALLRHWWWLLALGPILGGAAAVAITSFQPRIYSTNALLFVNQASSGGIVTYNDALLSQQLVKTYSQMADEPIVFEAVRQRLHLTYDNTTMDQMVSVRPIPQTQLFEVVVQGTNPEEIRDIANTLADVFIQQQRALQPAGQSISPVRVAQPALTPAAPISPRPAVNVALGVLVGLLLSAAIVRAIEYMDDTVKTPDDLERATGLQTLALVTNVGGKPGEAARALIGHPSGGSAEAYRLLRTNLEFAAAGAPLRTILVTSSGPREGKSTTSTNLSVALAQAGKRVTLVDADLRRPSLHRVFGTPNDRGLSTLLLDPDTYDLPRVDVADVDGLSVVPSGPLPPNPAELLASWRFTRVLERLRECSDVVVIDSPPVLSVADAIAIAGRVDGTIVVVDSRHTRPTTAQQGVQAITRSGTRMLGGVLNRLSDHSDGYYYYYYYHTDGSAETKNGGAARNGKSSTTTAGTPH